MIRQLTQAFKAPTPSDYARRELLEARMGLLKAYTALESAKAQVAFYDAQTKRLADYLELIND
jgi:hypothetical protein